MGGLDVNSIFTNVPLQETIILCSNLLYNNEDVIKGISKSQFKDLLSLAIQESYLILNGVLHKQKDSVAMRSHFDLQQQMFYCHFMKSNDLNSALRNLNQLFTEYMLMTFLFSSNRSNTSPNFVIILIVVIQICFSFEQEKNGITYLSIWCLVDVILPIMVRQIET